MAHMLSPGFAGSRKEMRFGEAEGPPAGWFIGVIPSFAIKASCGCLWFLLGGLTPFHFSQLGSSQAKLAARE